MKVTVEIGGFGGKVAPTGASRMSVLIAEQLLRVLDQDALQRCVVNPGMT